MKNFLISVLITGLLFISLTLSVTPLPSQAASVNTDQYYTGQLDASVGLLDLNRGVLQVQNGIFKNYQLAGSGDSDILTGKSLIQGAQTKINNAITSILGSIQ